MIRVQKYEELLVFASFLLNNAHLKEQFLPNIALLKEQSCFF